MIVSLKVEKIKLFFVGFLPYNNLQITALSKRNVSLKKTFCAPLFNENKYLFHKQFILICYWSSPVLTIFRNKQNMGN